MKPTFVSLFAGIGGGDLGFERAGFCVIGQVEFDKTCGRVLSHHWPGVHLASDIRTCLPRLFDTPSLCIVSDPCQRNVCANSRIADGRTPPSLWNYARRFIDELRPAFVVRENPTRILRAAPSPPERVAADLEGMRYVATIIDMQCGQISGVSRQRTFVCAALGSAGKRLRSVLAEHRCDKRDWPKVGSKAIPLAALTCHPYRYDNRDNFVTYGDGRIRVLSCAERLRVQGLPEDWLDCLGKRRLFTVARLTGNAWPVFAAEWLGRHVREAAPVLKKESVESV